MLTDPYKKIAHMEAVACTIGNNASRQAKVDEMMRYTEALIGEKEGKPARVTHEAEFEYNRRGELIGFFLKPIVREFINQL